METSRSVNEGVAESFTENFLGRSLAEQVMTCDSYELAPLFLELFQDHQPVLEAGCGSGRWCAWLGKRNIRCDGIDWSKALCDRASREIPESRFLAGDMQSMPFADGDYAGLLALGSLEHVPEGPVPALLEFYRVLRTDGLALLTVPYGGAIRRRMRWLQRPGGALKASPMIRRLFKKPSAGRSLAAARRDTVARWCPRFGYGNEGWYFYEYEFNKAQMRSFLSQTEFKIEREFVGFGDEGILHTFGRIAGRWSYQRSAADLNLLGRLLRACVPSSQAGHMLCYVVRKSGAS